VLLVEVILPRLTEDIPINIQQSTPMTPLRARMIADMISRDLGSASQTSHLRACKRFAAWLERSPETATPDDVKYFQQHLIESGTSICMRNLGVVTLTFLGQNIEAFENMFYCISRTYEILSPIKKTKSADN
jgi:hypothetical protein